MNSDRATLYLGNEPLAETEFTALKTPQVSKVLLPIFQKYFSASVSPLHSSRLKARRKLLYQLKALNKGQMSGAVWLYDSPLAGFASTRLESFNKRYLAMALHYRKTHHYRDAENIYRDLLKEAGEDANTKNINVLLTQCIIEDYNYRAKLYLAKHDFKSARRYLRKIIANYPDTKYATTAQNKLKGIIPVAVTYFKKQGQKYFHPEKHLYQPQTKAGEYFSKMYQEDPKGPQAGYAWYYWARSLGTQGKTQEALAKIKDFATQFPHSEMRGKALFLEAFYNGENSVKNYKRGALLMDQFARQYPTAKEADDALWYGAFYDALAGNSKDGIKMLQSLAKKYPKSKHTRHVSEWVQQFHKGWPK